MMLRPFFSVLASSSPSHRRRVGARLGERRCVLPPPQITASLSYCLPSRSQSARAAPHAARSRSRLIAAPPVEHSPRSATCPSRVASLRGVSRQPKTPSHAEAASDRRREPVPPPASYCMHGAALGRETKWMRLWEEIRKRGKKKRNEKKKKNGKRKGKYFIYF
jgi:hypothetical protein